MILNTLKTIVGRLSSTYYIRLLRYLKNAMHARVPGSEIIWYDSMTTNGSVQWQNNITPKNSIFFEAADGIFLNYWWNVWSIAISMTIPGY